MSSTRDVGRALQRPIPEVGSALSTIPEDQWFDRKSFRIAARELANVEIGLANADGGIIAVGIHDGEVEGTDSSPSHRNELCQAHIQFCQPPVPVKTRLLECRRADGEDDQLLVIEIPPGETVYANVKDEVYLRIGDENRRLTYAQRQELLYDRGHGSYEGRIVTEATVDDLDHNLLVGYATALGHPDPERLLQARGLAVENHLTVAGILLFAEHPQRVLPESFIRVLHYSGSERGTGARQRLIRDEKIEGPIARQLIRAREVVQEEQPRRRALTSSGSFEAVPLVPEDAWLEGLVNAAVHRSYSLAGDHVRFEIFSNRIEVTSPGRFPGLVDPANPLEAPRYARNPRIARVCADQNFGQELGEGIRRMFEEMRLAGLGDPLYEESAASVRLTLLGEPVDRRLEARLPRGSRLIMSTLRDAGSLSTGEVAETIGISRPTAASHLRALRDAGLIVWTGNSAKDPRASWSLPES
ncbi:MAG: ATP-binding protein [Acidimicrobiales bacterium]